MFQTVYLLDQQAVECLFYHQNLSSSSASYPSEQSSTFLADRHNVRNNGYCPSYILRQKMLLIKPTQTCQQSSRGDSSLCWWQTHYTKVRWPPRPGWLANAGAFSQLKMQTSPFAVVTAGILHVKMRDSVCRSIFIQVVRRTGQIWAWWCSRPLWLIGWVYKRKWNH